MDIEIKNIHKRFGSFVALDDISLTIAPGELVALLGPSGSGKTTLLRIIAGLEHPTSGAVLFGGEDLVGRSLRERRVGFVFQHYALFRHMTVLDNVAFGLRVKRRAERPREAEIKERVMELLDLVQLAPFADRYPSQLSGGQRQRVALARALAVEPSVLLLDEPFGALDAKVRKELRRWLRALHDEMQLTSLFVTHDQEEALELADRVVLMNNAAIEQIGTPEEVYARPASPFAYEFLGHVNRFRCTIAGGEAVLPVGTIALPDGDRPADGPALAFVRPHDLEIFDGPVMVGARAVVRYVSAAGPVVKVELAVNGLDAVVEAEIGQDEYRKLKPKVGATVFVRARSARVFAHSEASRAVVALAATAPAAVPAPADPRPAQPDLRAAP